MIGIIAGMQLFSFSLNVFYIMRKIPQERAKNIIFIGVLENVKLSLKSNVIWPSQSHFQPTWILLIIFLYDGLAAGLILMIYLSSDYGDFLHLFVLTSGARLDLITQLTGRSCQHTWAGPDLEGHLLPSARPPVWEVEGIITPNHRVSRWKPALHPYEWINSQTLMALEQH